MKKFVFIDESIRTRYTMAAVVVPIAKVAEYRRSLSKLRVRGSRSFHTTREKKNQQKQAVALLADLHYCELIAVSSLNQINKLARQECLKRIIGNLGRGSYILILDHTNQEKLDHETLFAERYSSEVEFEFLHLERHVDSGLWGADILAWSIGTEFEKNFNLRLSVKDARLSS